ncbi:bactofilin family protein [Amphibacillus sediminis]|uniref:bactofilin family protein n=1 Tax=Amphibacillus sediminis TaxID=360185 RepID=UPI000831A69D|nr:polymer-forming cytoskeletal protein [Amphibacillus sediminis]
MIKGKKQEKVIDTIIGKDTVIEGNLKLPTSIRIDGKVYGEIDCKGDVFIGKDGFVEPTIRAKNVVISGEAKGEIHTSQKVHIDSNGSVSGHVTSAGIIIEEGGMFNGTSKINTSKTKSNKLTTEPSNQESLS